MVSVSFDRRAFEADLLLIDRQADRATMWGLREMGRKLKRAEKKLAPVYKGPGGVRRLAKGREGPMQRGPVVGLLRASISSARSFRKLGPAEYELVVGPRGGRVNLYKGKIERKYQFAATASAQVAPEAPAVFAAAWGRALARGR